MGIEDYRRQSEIYLQQGDEEFSRGDLRQASEKYWDAASRIVKAFAEKNGWVHNGHALLYKVVNRIADEIGDREIMGWFGNAVALHQNFYEGWFTRDEIEVNAEFTKSFIEKIKTLL